MAVQLLPDDASNQELVRNVHPPDWVNPEPARCYNLVVIGAGTAGLVTAAGAAGLGARVALVERHLMGGDCLNFGCVPSKAVLRAARAVADVREAGAFGLAGSADGRVDFAAVMQRMRRLRAHISHHDSAQRFRTLGVDVFLGDGRFTGRDTLEVGGRSLRFRKAVIATGTRPAVPPIAGLAESGYLTNETVFSLTELPGRLAVIGGGPIGCELAQAFARFGSRVWLVQSRDRILPRDDREAAERVAAALKRDGVTLVTSAKALEVRRQDGDRTVRVRSGSDEIELRVDAVLVAVGRTPNVDRLGLDAAGVEHSEQDGVQVDDRLRTSNPRIYAAGDICSRFKFTHAADAMARIAIRNALFLGRARASALAIPWCTYTDPELAQVGLTESDANERAMRIRTFVQELKEVDRAVLDGESDGFVKVHVTGRRGRIVGATVVARHAGEMISELTLAIVGRLGLGKLAHTIHPYPTQAEAIKRVADAYYRTRLTPLARSLSERWLSWAR